MIDFETDTKGGLAYIEVLQKAKRLFYDPKNKERSDDIVEIKINNTGGYRENIPLTQHEEDIEFDSESLYTSDVLENFIKDADIID